MLRSQEYIAIGYGGSAELVQALRKICERIEREELNSCEADERIIEQNLYTVGLPNPDLLSARAGRSGLAVPPLAIGLLGAFLRGRPASFTKLDSLRAIPIQSRER